MGEDWGSRGGRSIWADLTAPALPRSVGMRAGAFDFQGVETPRPLINAPKGAQKKATTIRRHKDMGKHRIG